MIEQVKSVSLKSATDQFNKLVDSIKPLSVQLFSADNGKMFPVDLLTIAALKRTWGNSDGFQTLIMSQNLVAARSLLRIQVDTLIRYHAVWLVEDPHDFANYVHRGERIDKYKCKDGTKLSDFYLVSKLSQNYAWIKPVYESLCGYVHFSSSHINSSVKAINENRVSFEIGPKDSFPEFSWVEAVDCYSTIMMILFSYIDGWIRTKNGEHQKSPRSS